MNPLNLPGYDDCHDLMRQRIRMIGVRLQVVHVLVHDGQVYEFQRFFRVGERLVIAPHKLFTRHCVSAVFHTLVHAFHRVLRALDAHVVHGGKVAGGLDLLQELQLCTLLVAEDGLRDEARFVRKKVPAHHLRHGLSQDIRLGRSRHKPQQLFVDDVRVDEWKPEMLQMGFIERGLPSSIGSSKEVE